MFADAVRRGLSHPHTASFVKRAVTIQGEGEHEKIDISGWSFALLYVSFMASMVFMTLLSYMLKEVVTTLCMVETPHAAITVSPSTSEPADKGEKEGLLEAGPTITLVHQKPITSSIRATIKHVVANAGTFARFRGLRVHAIYSLAFVLAASFFEAALPRVPGQAILVSALSGAVLANLHAVWTHRVVSMPTTKSFWQRLPSKSNWKTLALPAAIAASMPYVSVYLTIGVGALLGLHREDPEQLAGYSAGQLTCLAMRIFAVAIFAVLCSLFLCLPAMVTLVRIEASILPEDEDTIVPFDRTFDGKAVSQMHGGSGKVGFLDAWRSFNWEARRRLIKLFVKASLIMVGVFFFVAHVLAFEVFAIFGPQLGQLLSQIDREGMPEIN
jgi:hypothetical protein